MWYYKVCTWKIYITLLRRLCLCWLRQEKLGRRLEGVTRHQNQLLKLQKLLDVLQKHEKESLKKHLKKKKEKIAVDDVYLGRELE